MAKHPKSPQLTVVSGRSGHLVVASDALLAAGERLGHVSNELHTSKGVLRGLANRDDVVPSLANSAPYAALEAHSMMEAALRQLATAEVRAASIQKSISISLELYGRLEEGLQSVMHAADERVAQSIGSLVAVVGVPFAMFAAPAVLTMLATGKEGDVGTGIQNFLKAHPSILNNPFTVAAIREAASDVDGFTAGLYGVPPDLALALDESGVTSVKTSASEVIGLGNDVGLLKETPVTVKKTSSFAFGRPPTSLVDRANSFPDAHADPNGEQIRIDKYSTPGQPDKYDVFISGTVTFDPKSGTQPFDFTSDMQGVADHSPASVRAVEQAMRAAGITSSSPVVVNGYSQGGLVASGIAASGQFNVKGVVTFGAPTGQVHIPASIPVLAVRNTEDIVPATSGYDVDRTS